MCEVALLVIAQSSTAITVVDVSCISVLHAVEIEQVFFSSV